MAKLSVNGTTASTREGIGTIIRFRMEAEQTTVGVVRENGVRVLLTCEPELAGLLLKEFGYQRDASFISVEPLIGLKVRYKESCTGMLVEVHPLKN